MKIVIIGSGVAGAVTANFLKKQGHDVLVLEKETIPGGMCKSYFKDGFTYEYGPHILAIHNSSQAAADFLKSNIDVVQTQLSSASMVGNKITYYPPSTFSAERLGILEQVEKEIKSLPSDPNCNNFETYLLDKVGPTIYRVFFKEFTRKFWGVDPATLSADWAKTRRLGESLHSKKMFFNDKWCAYPRTNWNQLFINVLKDINVLYGVEVKKVNFQSQKILLGDGSGIDFDLVISTMHIDQLFEFNLGRLQYAGYRIEPKVIDKSEAINLDNSPVSMTYFPDPETPYCRVTNYGSFQQKDHFPYNNRTILTYEYPDHSIRLYPFTDNKNLSLFESYLTLAANQPRLITFGRMGLFKYLTSDTTVEMAFRLMPHLNEWLTMGTDRRLEAYRNIRGNWSN